MSTLLLSRVADRAVWDRPARSHPAIVRVDGLVKRFAMRRGWKEAIRHPRRRDFNVALDDVSFTVGPHEFFGLLGPNGAGKTTLFKILATLIEPDQGSVHVAGLDVVREAAGVRNVLTPVIASERSLAWRLSARDNLELFAGLHRLPRKHIPNRIDEVLDVVGLVHTGRQLVGEFSSGMRQRLLIARALLARPRVLLLDEPTRSLDPVSARRFRSFLREEIVGQQGCSVLLATHNTEEALDLCDRVAILHQGKILALGTADALSKQVAPERFRIWTSDPSHSALRAMVEQGLIGFMREGAADREGWWVLEVDIAGNHEESARALALMVESRIPISRFERVTPTLADVIDHVIVQGGDSHE